MALYEIIGGKTEHHCTAEQFQLSQIFTSYHFKAYKIQRNCVKYCSNKIQIVLCNALKFSVYISISKDGARIRLS